MIAIASLATASAAALVAAVLLRVPRHRRSIAKRSNLPGTNLTSVQYWGALFGVAGFAYLLVYAITGLVVVSAVPALLMATMPRAYMAKRRAEQTARIQEAWPDGIRDILASVRSGASLPNAVEDLATFGPAALRDAFQGFAVYARSLGVVKALEMVKDDLADPTSDRVIEVLILAYERGGRVVPEILEDLATATTRDLWTMEQVRNDALEQKINARIVFVMPWLVLVILTSRSGAFREFYATPGGLVVVIIGAVLSLAGIWIASRLAVQPDEPRVFAGETT